MGRIGYGMSRTAAHAAWATAAVAIVWFALPLVQRLLGAHDWSQSDFGSPELTPLVPMGLLACIGLSTCTLWTPGQTSSRWHVVLISFAAAAFACAGLLMASEALGGHPIHLLMALEDASIPGLMLVVAMLLVAADTLRREGLSNADLTIRMAVASSVIWLAGVWISSHSAYAWACISSPFPADHAARGVVGAYAPRILCGLAASGCLIAALVSGFIGRRESRLELLPLLGFATWVTSRVGVDVFTHGVAEQLGSAQGSSPGWISEQAMLAEALGTVGLAIASTCWALAAVRSVALRKDGVMEAWSGSWPLVPLLLLSILPPFDPSSVVRAPHQLPEPTWSEVNVEPLTWTTGEGYIPVYWSHVDNVVTGVLSAGGELHLFRAGRYVPRRPVEYTGGMGSIRRVELVVDRRATLGDLRQAVLRLSDFTRVSIVWRHNTLHETSSGARERWPFVEMTSRALRGRHVRLVSTLDHCGVLVLAGTAAASRSCVLGVQEDEPWWLMFIEGSDDVLILDWLEATSGMQQPFALSVPLVGFEQPPPVLEPEQPGDPRFIRMARSGSLFGVVVGGLASVFVLLVFILLEFRFVSRLIRERSVVEMEPVPDRPHRPSWVSWQLATLRVVLGRDGNAYRSSGTQEVMVAPFDTAWRELLRVARRLLFSSLSGTIRWVVLAASAGAFGHALSLLVSG